MSSLHKSTHRFKVGDRVKMLEGLPVLAFPHAEYEVVQLLPAQLASEGSSFQYKLRDRHSGHVRVASETQIGSALLTPS